ncbi:MAG: hypothetical protein AB2693_16165 [Candidatus Thiodiazotropha sp.]
MTILLHRNASWSRRSGCWSINSISLAKGEGAPTEVEKLVLNLKERYVRHYRNLQLYLRLGIRLKKIRRALRF